jgi:hypothetical protein
MNVTANEMKVLIAILRSEYQDAAVPQDAVNNPVWTDYVNPFSSKKSMGGVVASLVTKGLVTIYQGTTAASNKDSAGQDPSTIALTQAGVDTLNDAQIGVKAGAAPEPVAAPAPVAKRARSTGKFIATPLAVERGIDGLNLRVGSGRYMLMMFALNGGSSFTKAEAAVALDGYNLTDAISGMVRYGFLQQL